MERKRIIMVNEGSWGRAEEKHYDAFMPAMQGALEHATKKDLHSGKEEKRAEFVKIVDTVEEALERVRRSDADILIFRSRSMISEARRINKQYRRLKVLVLTGLIPDDEVVLVDKGWIAHLGSQVLETIVFD